MTVMEADASLWKVHPVARSVMLCVGDSVLIESSPNERSLLSGIDLIIQGISL